MKDYPNTKNVSNETFYVLYETTVDNEGNVLKNTKNTFKSEKEMNSFEQLRKEEKSKEIKKIESSIVSFSIPSDGSTEYTYYSSMKMGLSLYKFTSSRFFTACTYEWLSLPAPGIGSTSKLQAVVGLSLAPQLTMDASTYGGRVSYTTNYLYGTQIGQASYNRNNSNGGISIQATGAQGIGFSFTTPHYTGANYEIVTSMSGVISCIAYKSNTLDQYCSIFGEYDDVSLTLSLSNFSVSYPLGISFGLATSRTRYTAQGALDIR